MTGVQPDPNSAPMDAAHNRDMTYPPLYHGDNGEISTTLRRNGSEPELVYPNGSSVHYLATGKSTGGLFGLHRYEFGPELTGPDPHFHRSTSESWYILSGSMRIYDGTQWVTTEQGDYVHVPPGGIHAFKNESGAPVSMLLHFSPGAPREDFFEGVIRLPQMTDEEKKEFFHFHDTFGMDSHFTVDG
jgi:mannose-6-phosphate isomerase-like protein (cupin superfamily)